MIKRPCEIFGHPASDRSRKARGHVRRHWCLFKGTLCSKKSRLIDYPMGVCSVQVGGDCIAICPVRFLQDGIVFSDIARLHFGRLENLVVFSEVTVPPAGSFDFVIVKHRPLSSEVDGFAIVEFQTGQTTSTGHLVEALEDATKPGRTLLRSYGFGMNYADIWKRSFTQVPTKGIAAEHWGEKIYWVLQEPVYRYFVRKYKLEGLAYDPACSTTFVIYDLQRTDDSFRLVHTRTESATLNRLFSALRNNQELPSKEEFLEKLHRKLERRLYLGLRVEWRQS